MRKAVEMTGEFGVDMILVASRGMNQHVCTSQSKGKLPPFNFVKR